MGLFRIDMLVFSLRRKRQVFAPQGKDEEF